MCKRNKRVGTLVAFLLCLTMIAGCGDKGQPVTEGQNEEEVQIFEENEIEEFSCDIPETDYSALMFEETEFDESQNMFIPSDTSGVADILSIPMGAETPTDHGYKISSVKGFMYFTELVNSGTDFLGLKVTLATDIDLNPGVQILDENNEIREDVNIDDLYKFPGIGYYDKENKEEYSFNGTFDGNGYVIKGLVMTDDSSINGGNRMGMFSLIKDATLQNVGIIDSIIVTDKATKVGLLLGDTGNNIGREKSDMARVVNCFAIGQIDASKDEQENIGGLIGCFGVNGSSVNELISSYSDVLVKTGASQRVSLLVGQNMASINGCIVAGGKLEASKATKDIGALQGKRGSYGDETCYVVENLVNAPACKTYSEESGDHLVFDTYDNIQELIDNKTFVSCMKNEYVLGQGIMTVQNDKETYSRKYYSSRVDEFSNEVFEPEFAFCGEDGGHDYSWSVSEDGIKGLPDVVLDGSSSNVTPELLEALDYAINTPGFFKPAKNIIFLVGDGMGIDPVTASENWAGELIMNNLPAQAASMTKSYTSASSSNWTPNFDEVFSPTYDLTITDSGAGGTAIATGYKTYYYSICSGMDGTALKTLSDVARETGRKVGCVTNGWISDATPADFISAHSWMRGVDDNEQAIEIIKQKKLQEQMFDLVPDVLIGYAESDELIGQMFQTKAAFASENNMSYYENWNDFINTDDEHAILATQSAWGYDADNDAISAIGSGSEEAKVTEMVKTLPNMCQSVAGTLQRLQRLSEKDGNGFFVMFEDGEIDADGHSNIFMDQITEIQNLDESVAIAVKFALENPDTIVLISADHDTGGMTLKEGWENYMRACNYSSVGHSASNVPVYALGYGTDILNGQIYQNAYTGRILGVLMGDSTFGDSEHEPMVILDGGEYGANRITALVDTDEPIGNSMLDKYETYNVLSEAEKQELLEENSYVLWAPPTMKNEGAKLVKPGDKLSIPEDPDAIISGKTFTGWYKDEACTQKWDFNKDVVKKDGDTVLYAGWK